MNTVYVLIAILFNGHLSNGVIPTLEFSSLERCKAAILAFESESNDRSGTVRMRCVKIEK